MVEAKGIAPFCVLGASEMTTLSSPSPHIHIYRYRIVVSSTSLLATTVHPTSHTYNFSWGVQRELNPYLQSHNLVCNHYTMDTTNPILMGAEIVTPLPRRA